jgi:hypothetical protein
MKYLAFTAMVLATLTPEAHAVRSLITALSFGVRSLAG